MAKWLSEMAKRGLGLKPGEFLKCVLDIVKKDKRKTPFKDDCPSYDWYYAFMTRNCHIVGPRKEVCLEYCRAKLTAEALDKWYADYKEFLVGNDLIDKLTQIWNAVESDFVMGSKAGRIIGPAKSTYQVPHMTGFIKQGSLHCHVLLSSGWNSYATISGIPWP